MSKIFEVVQSMSGQKNCVVIPRPYLDFFFGDPQAHLLGAILNQLVFWSGKASPDENGWFYKAHDELAAEISGVTGDQVRKAVSKLTKNYLPGILEEKIRKVNGTPTKHYRVDGEVLITKLFPSELDSAILPNGNGNIADPNRQKNRMETAEKPNGNGNTAESYLYPDQYIQINKNPSCQDAAQPDVSADEEFISRHPEAVVFSAKKKLWGSADDLKCAEWIWSRIIAMYEQAAESDGEISRPKEPNWTAWANEVRLMCSQDGRTHKQICQLFGRANRDKFWCRNVLSPSKLRERWDDLVIKLAPAAHVETNTAWNTAEGWGETL